MSMPHYPPLDAVPLQNIDSPAPLAQEITLVLIVGAGSTGLTAALELSRLGVPIRQIDKLATPSTTLRALAVRSIMRHMDTSYDELDLDNATWNDEQLVNRCWNNRT